MEANHRLTRGLTFILAIAAGLSVANIYYNQSLLGIISERFAANPGAVHFMPSATQLGYAAGLLLLVPLGDLGNRRRVILWQTVSLAISLAVLALASSPAMLLIGSVLTGITSTVAQQIIPLAADLAPPDQRGRVVGTVMSGLLAGILLARTLSGFLGQIWSWQGVYVVGALMTVALGVVLYATLPSQHHTRPSRYSELLASLGHLTLRHASLRWSVMRQGGLFGVFSAFWSILALYLAGPPYHLGSEAAGLFGILGLGGVVAAPLAGRLADARGPNRLITLGGLLVLAGVIVFMMLPTYLGIGIGTIVMDTGVQVSMVANQNIIFALDPNARNRINTIYMTGMFLWGAIGSALASIAWAVGQWEGVMVLSLAMGVMSLASHWRSQHSGKDTGELDCA